MMFGQRLTAVSVYYTLLQLPLTHLRKHISEVNRKPRFYHCSLFWEIGWTYPNKILHLREPCEVQMRWCGGSGNYVFQRLGNSKILLSRISSPPQYSLWQTQPLELPNCNHCEAFVLCILLLIFTHETNEAVAGFGWGNMEKSKPIAWSIFEIFGIQF